MNEGWAALMQLTPKEREVLLALMRGATAREISKECYVSLPTVRSQIRGILSKLGVSSQLAAVAVAYRSGWPANTISPFGERSTEKPDTLAVGM
jgi:DNA-binding CsgD family transcriptional regulator